MNKLNVRIFIYIPNLTLLDPISPLLFVICMEYLSRCLNCATKKDGFKFHAKCENFKVSHLAFSDDLMIITRGNFPSVKIVFDVLHEFGAHLVYMQIPSSLVFS